MKTLALNIFEDMLLLALASYDLWCFFAGAFYEPRMPVLVLEHVALWLLILFSIWRVFQHMREAMIR